MAMPMMTAESMLDPKAPMISRAELLELCREAKQEARDARSTGPSPRDAVWARNLDIYWMRTHAAGKAAWQHKEASSRGKKAVDRFAAALTKSLMQPGEWYVVEDPSHSDETSFLPVIRRVLDAVLGTCGTTASGQWTSFPFVFSRLMRLGALMSADCAVTWDTIHNRLRIDPVDPRELFYDPSGAGRYRVRTRELDRHVVASMPYIDPAALAGLGDWSGSEEAARRERSTGHGGGQGVSRRKILVDELLFDVLVDRRGDVVARGVLVVVGNEQAILRGPEENPYAHGEDWIVKHPLLDAPLSIYGSTYVEDFASTLFTFDELVNLVLDGTQAQLLPQFSVDPSWLADPKQLAEGLRPFKVWLRGELAVPGQPLFERAEFGRIGREGVELLAALMTELREATSQNEISMGQLPRTGEKTATEIMAVGESQSELVQDIAEGIDTGLLAPLLRLAWMCTLQHVDTADPRISRLFGPDIAAMIGARRHEILGRSFSFRASAVTGLAARTQRARSILGLMQVLAQNDALVGEFLRGHSLANVVGDLFASFGMSRTEYLRSPSDPPPILPPRVAATLTAGGGAPDAG